MTPHRRKDARRRRRWRRERLLNRGRAWGAIVPISGDLLEGAEYDVWADYRG
jgi:hypothetical protein